MIEQDVAALEVAVDDRRHGVLVQELECPGTVEGYTEPSPPVQGPVLHVWGMEVVLQAPMGHVLKDQEPMVLISTVAKQFY